VPEPIPFYEALKLMIQGKICSNKREFPYGHIYTVKTYADSNRKAVVIDNMDPSLRSKYGRWFHEASFVSRDMLSDDWFEVKDE
jgi:hypothetical protein